MVSDCPSIKSKNLYLLGVFFTAMKNNTGDCGKLDVEYNCEPSTSRTLSDPVVNTNDEDLKALALFLDAEDDLKQTKGTNSPKGNIPSNDYNC